MTSQSQHSREGSPPLKDAPTKRSASGRVRGVSTMISWTPTPFIRSWNPSARRPHFPSIRNSGLELETFAPHPAKLGRSLGGSRLCDLNDSGFYESCQIDPIHPQKVAMRSRVECDLLK
jgi:hypothetical protein